MKSAILNWLTDNPEHINTLLDRIEEINLFDEKPAYDPLAVTERDIGMPVEVSQNGKTWYVRKLVKISH